MLFLAVMMCISSILHHISIHKNMTEIVTICCLVHFFIVVSSIAQPDGTAPMAEFANVFDPSGDPQTAMVGMMQVSVG
jgi:hypothetical protein